MEKKPDKQAKSKKRSGLGHEKETRVLLEQTNQSTQTVAEQHSDIVDKLEEINEKLQEHDSVLFKVEMGVETVKSRVGTIDIKVDRIEKELGTANSAIKDVDIRLGKKVLDHEQRLQRLEVVK